MYFLIHRSIFVTHLSSLLRHSDWESYVCCRVDWGKGEKSICEFALLIFFHEFLDFNHSQIMTSFLTGGTDDVSSHKTKFAIS